MHHQILKENIWKRKLEVHFKIDFSVTLPIEYGFKASKDEKKEMKMLKKSNRQ